MDTKYYCPHCGRQIEYYFSYCCWCGAQLNHPEYSNVKEEEKTYFDRDAYTYEGPIPSIYYKG